VGDRETGGAGRSVGGVPRCGLARSCSASPHRSVATAGSILLVGFLALPPALGLGLDQRGIVTVLGQPACSFVVCETLALTTYIDGVGLGHGVALILFVRCMSVGEGSERAHFAPQSGDGACGACRSEPGHRFAQRFDQSGRPCGAARAPGSSGRRTGCFGNDGGDIGAEPPTRASRPAPPLGRGPWGKLTN